MADEEEVKKFNVRLIISSMANERRTINMGECDEDTCKDIVSTVNTAFGVIRASQALMLTGSDGVVVFANLDNIAFVEVHIG